MPNSFGINDAKFMMLSAIRDKNPVIVIEHRWCHYLQDKVLTEKHSQNSDGPKIIKKGKDFTIVSVSYMTVEAIIAAKFLKKLGIEVEVIDLRVLRPLNVELIRKSLKKTRNLMTVDLGWKSYGIGSEIIARLFCDGKINLINNPIRLGVAEKPTPSSRGLVEDHYPNSKIIVKEIGKSLKISKGKIKEVIKLLNSQLSPVDVPNNIFKGPF